MSVLTSPAFDGHEAVHAFFESASGFRGFIAIHSTARGPAAGGCRLWPYPSEQAAVDDALELSRAMSFKNAVADLELGGGKAVIIGDAGAKTPALFEALGAAVERLGGAYWSAEDVGISPADLGHARRRTRFVAGLEGAGPAASGDPSPITAEGVFRGLTLCARRALGRDVGGLHVAIQGVGHVGAGLAARLAGAGARLTVCDISSAASKRVAAETGADVVAPEAIFDVPADVFAPCALGGAISADTLGRISAKVIAGGANNQLASPGVGEALFAAGKTYAPDFVINGGGIINIAAEIRALAAGGAYDRKWVEAKLSRLMATLEEVLDRSAAERRPTHELALEIARERIGAAARARGGAWPSWKPSASPAA
ncbi:MAG TPA: Glu/Leu/Phe/Val dehydrogenase dimerization domain-containing protein [Caulobacteraceae bacterium]|nr:Glu/Leu/Phe/Val dehydrogenase dimerization domain-containing protein [Caulobacteraceae bacterium]